jgi:hypothetical protein
VGIRVRGIDPAGARAHSSRAGVRVCGDSIRVLDHRMLLKRGSIQLVADAHGLMRASTHHEQGDDHNVPARTPGNGASIRVRSARIGQTARSIDGAKAGVNAARPEPSIIPRAHVLARRGN